MAAVDRSVPALVTGASSGIGEEFARQLAARGHDVVVVARRRDRLTALERELESAHPVEVTPLVADLETPAGREAVVARLRSGGPWLLVNSAGFGTRGRAAELAVEREVGEVAVNAVAVHQLTLAALQVDAAHRAGGIINVASLAGYQPIPYFATYAATKAFVLHLTEALAVEARGSGVRLMALCPGPVRTEFTDGGMEAEARIFDRLFMDTDRCVRTALRAFDRGHTICVPGALMQATGVASRLMPRGVIRRTSGRVQELLGLDRSRPAGDPREPAPTARPTAGRKRTPPRRPG